MSIINIYSTADAKTFVENSGIINWIFTGNASAEGFAAWVRANCSEINTENYETELTEYLISVGENPTDYGLVKSNSAPTPNPSPEVQGADSAAVAVNGSGATWRYYYIERCDDGSFLGLDDKWHEKFPEAALFDSWNEAAAFSRKSRTILKTSSDTAIKSGEHTPDEI